MELGALICTPRQPQCRICPLGRICSANRQGNPEQYPAGKSRVPLLRRVWFSFLIESHGRFLIRQRPRKSLNAELWEFPTAEFEGSPEADPTAAARVALGSVPQPITFAGAFRHNITRHQIMVRVFRAEVSHPTRFEGGGEWLTQTELSQRPLAGAHKKIFQRYLGSGR
jgi:A/G-specific adenine glycosylase